MTRFTKKNSSRGFTLVELLVVIAIIALLAALSIGVYASAISRANSIKCCSNLREIGAAMLSFAADHNNNLPESGGTIPFGSTDTGTYGTKQGTGLPSWTEQLMPYIGPSTATAANAIWQCPDSSKRSTDGSGQPLYDSQYSYFNGAHAAYALVASGNGGAGNFAAVNLTRMRDPSNHIMAGDIAFNVGFSANDADKDDYTQDPAFDGGTPSSPTTIIIHNGYSNIVFADGHVESLKYFDKTSQTTVYDGPGYDYLYPTGNN